jgi:hypothetical protein
VCYKACSVMTRYYLMYNILRQAVSKHTTSASANNNSLFTNKSGQELGKVASLGNAMLHPLTTLCR